MELEDYCSAKNIEKIINGIIDTKIKERKTNKLSFTKETKFSDIDFDSLDVMETIIETEGAVRRRIENKRIKNIFTVEDLYNLFKFND